MLLNGISYVLNIIKLYCHFTGKKSTFFVNIIDHKCFHFSVSSDVYLTVRNLDRFFFSFINDLSYIFQAKEAYLVPCDL